MENSNNQKNELKVVLIGNSGVGKTCIIHYCKEGKFLENIPTTTGSSFTKIKRVYNDKKYILNFWDTAGQEKYRSLSKQLVINAQIIILVYAINDLDSFKELPFWMDIVKENNGEDGYVLGLAANKNDLYKESKVEEKDGQNYANKINALFMKTSVKDAFGINELIEQLLKHYLCKYNVEAKKGIVDIKPNNVPEGKKGCCK